MCLHPRRGKLGVPKPFANNCLRHTAAYDFRSTFPIGRFYTCRFYTCYLSSRKLEFAFLLSESQFLRELHRDKFRVAPQMRNITKRARRQTRVVILLLALGGRKGTLQQEMLRDRTSSRGRFCPQARPSLSELLWGGRLASLTAWLMLHPTAAHRFLKPSLEMCEPCKFEQNSYAVFTRNAFSNIFQYPKWL